MEGAPGSQKHFSIVRSHFYRKLNVSSRPPVWRCCCLISRLLTSRFPLGLMFNCMWRFKIWTMVAPMTGLINPPNILTFSSFDWTMHMPEVICALSTIYRVCGQTLAYPPSLYCILYSLTTLAYSPVIDLWRRVSGCTFILYGVAICSSTLGLPP
jgi:hypothetical protein